MSPNIDSSHFFQIQAINELSGTSWKQIVSLEEKNFPDPWSIKTLQLNLQEPYFFFIHSEKEKIMAYAIFLLALDSVDLLTICVDKTCQGSGMAHRFLSNCLDSIHGTVNAENIFFTNKEVVKCFLEVRVSNFPAIAFYKKYGFTQVGVRKAYYEDNKEDALVMRKHLQKL